MRPNGNAANEMNEEEQEDNFVKVTLQRYGHHSWIDFVFNFEDVGNEFEDWIQPIQVYSNQIYKIIDTLHFFLCTQSINTQSEEMSIFLQALVRSRDPTVPSHRKWLKFNISLAKLLECGYTLNGTEEIDQCVEQRECLQRLIFHDILTEEAIESEIKIQDKMNGQKMGRLIEEDDGTTHYENFDPKWWNITNLYFDDSVDTIHRFKIIVNKY